MYVPIWKFVDLQDFRSFCDGWRVHIFVDVSWEIKSSLSYCALIEVSLQSDSIQILLQGGLCDQMQKAEIC